MIAWRANRAFGERNNAWRERVNKSAIAGCVAGWTGIEKSAAGEVVDTAFELIAEALADGEDVRAVGFRTFRHQASPSPHGAQSALR